MKMFKLKAALVALILMSGCSVGPDAGQKGAMDEFAMKERCAKYNEFANSLVESSLAEDKVEHIEKIFYSPKLNTCVAKIYRSVRSIESVHFYDLLEKTNIKSFRVNADEELSQLMTLYQLEIESF